MNTILNQLMTELQCREKSLEELQDSYLRSVREEMEFGHYDKSVSEHYQTAIEFAKAAIDNIQKRIDDIEGNEEFINMFGEELHAIYQSDNPDFNKFTKLENAVTSWPSWVYVIPGEPMSLLFDDSEPSATVPMSAFPKHKEAQFVTYKNKSRYITLAFAPEINTVFVRR